MEPKTLYDAYKESGISLAHEVGFSIKFGSPYFALLTVDGKITSTFKQFDNDKVSVQILERNIFKELTIEETMSLLGDLKAENRNIDNFFKQACAIALEGGDA